MNMSADLNTFISVKGKSEELAAILKVLRSFETEKHEQYKSHRDCAYIDSVSVKGASGDCRIWNMTDEEISSFISTAGNELEISASGPWGDFRLPSETELFEAMADAAPGAAFEVNIDGFITGAELSGYAKLTDGLVYISEYELPNEVLPGLYTENFKQKLPYSKFCELFKVDEENFGEADYEWIIYDLGFDGFPNEMDYDNFLDMCEASEIAEDEYESAVKKVSDWGLVSYEDFEENFNKDDFAEVSIYDPKTKTYSRNSD